MARFQIRMHERCSLMTYASQGLNRSAMDRAHVAGKIRGNADLGEELQPGAKLSGTAHSDVFYISRNTLREVFRPLTSQNPLTCHPKPGSSSRPWAKPASWISTASGALQKGAVQAATSSIRRWLARRTSWRERARPGRMPTGGRSNHQHGISPLDGRPLRQSPRFVQVELVLAELRLVFARFEDTAHLHEPYIALNAALFVSLERGDIEAASNQLPTTISCGPNVCSGGLQQRRSGLPGGAAPRCRAMDLPILLIALLALA